MSTTESGFKAIESQEELDRIIKDRLVRERDAATKRYEGWISPEDHRKALDESNKAFEDYKKDRESDAKTIEELKAKNAAYEMDSLKQRVAREVGLSYDWVSRISGTDEKTIREDAESLKKLVGAGTSPLPTKTTDREGADSKKDAMRSVLNGIKNN